MTGIANLVAKDAKKKEAKRYIAFSESEYKRVAKLFSSDAEVKPAMVADVLLLITETIGNEQVKKAWANLESSLSEATKAKRIDKK